MKLSATQLYFMGALHTQFGADVTRYIFSKIRTKETHPICGVICDFSAIYATWYHSGPRYNGTLLYAVCITEWTGVDDHRIGLRMAVNQDFTTIVSPRFTVVCRCICNSNCKLGYLWRHTYYIKHLIQSDRMEGIILPSYWNNNLCEM